MAFDAHKNFALSLVASAPTPATSGTSLTVTSSEGALFPAAPFNATIAPPSGLPTSANAEIVRVTARTGDVFTLARAQEGSTARAVQVGDLIAATITAKSLTDLESGANFPQLATAGTVTTAAGVVTPAVTMNTPDGADNGYIALGGGGAANNTRGGTTYLLGNENAQSGCIQLLAGDPNGRIEFYTGPTGQRGTMHPSGGFGWGTATDPGPAVILVSGGGASGSELQTTIGRGFVTTGTNLTTSSIHENFYNPNGLVGSIQTNGTATAYLTASDQRLKTDRGRLADRTVLQRTIVHAFDWQTDGTPGRGVFAQEAITVAPFAVSEGTDERDEHGRLTKPWQVDYAKYVPDLIAGWQSHDADLVALRARLAFLEGAATARRPVSALRVMGAAIMARVRGWLAPLRPAKV